MPDIGIKTAPEIKAKTVGEVVIKTITFESDDFATGETINSIVSTTITRDDGVVMGGTDLTVDSGAYSGQVVQLTLSKGVLGAGYNLVVRVTTTTGQTLDGKVRMVVRSA